MQGSTIESMDLASVKDWQSTAKELNERTEKVLREAQEILKELQASAEGDIFDALGSVADNFIGGLTQILKSVEELCTVLDSIVSELTNFIESGIEGVKKLGQMVTGG